METRSATFDLAALEDQNKPGTLSSFTCPECQGPIWEIRDGELLRFRCRTGHAYSGENMLAGKTEALEAALWVALNTLEESMLVAKRLSDDARARNHLLVAECFEERVRDTHQRAELIREVLLNGQQDTALDRQALNQGGRDLVAAPQGTGTAGSAAE